MLNKNRNLSKQLLITILINYILITMLVTTSHMLLEYKNTKADIKNELKTIASTFQPALKTALWDLNTEQLESITNGMLSMPLIYGVTLIDPNRTKIIDIVETSCVNKKRHEHELSYTFNIQQKFNKNNIYLADITIYSDREVIFDRLKIAFGMIVLNAFIQTAALIILFTLAFRDHLGRPLQELTQRISSLKWESKDNRHIDVKFKNENELSVLQLTFNKLLSKISNEEEQKFELIKNQNIKLEYDVKQRTKELEEVNKKLKELASTDPLTKLNNRFKIDKELLKKYDSYQRYERIFSVIMMDIDFFKIVNDEHGHQVGDYVLQTIAHIIKDNIRTIDVAGRWGGEEFFIICKETDLEGAQLLAEKIRKIIESYRFNHVENKTASFGVAQITKDLSIDALIKKADDALYVAKNSGRNKTVIATH